MGGTKLSFLSKLANFGQKFEKIPFFQIKSSKILNKGFNIKHSTNIEGQNDAKYNFQGYWGNKEKKATFVQCWDRRLRWYQMC